MIDCPNETVPILRNTKEYVANAQYFAEKHFNSFTVESHGTHFAGVRLQGHDPYYGVGSWMSIHDLNISRDQVSYANIYVGSRINNKDNFIQTGWMGLNGAGCYNQVCPCFVQVSLSDLLSNPLPPGPRWKRNLAPTIQQDKKSGNWWLSDAVYNKPDILIGYWPKEIFDLLSNGVKMVGTGGAVESSPSGVSPPMGSGHFPSKDSVESASVVQMIIIDSSSKEFKQIDKSKLEKLLDNDKCYGLKRGNYFLYNYGGPGRNSCGI